MAEHRRECEYIAGLTCDLAGGPDDENTCRRHRMRTVARRCVCVHESSSCKTWWTGGDTCRRWTAYDVCCTLTHSQNYARHQTPLWHTASQKETIHRVTFLQITSKILMISNVYRLFFKVRNIMAILSVCPSQELIVSSAHHAHDSCLFTFMSIFCGVRWKWRTGRFRTNSPRMSQGGKWFCAS